MTARRFLAASAVAGATVASVLFGAPAANAAVPDSFTFSDDYDGDYACPGFDVTFTGSDRGLVKTYFDQGGTPIKEEGHIHYRETHRNEATGQTIVVRSNVAIHSVLAPDRSQLTWSITGELNVANRPGDGIILHDTGYVGLAAIEADPGFVVTALHGVHDTFTSDADPFCEALS